MNPLLRIEDLEVRFSGPNGDVRAVDGLSFALARGETYGLVGESGCGKSMTALAVLRLVEPGLITRGRILFDGRDLLELGEKEMRAVRGAGIGMVFQEASAALNPVMRVGSQVVEAIRVHRKIRRRKAWDEAVRLLGLVALPDPAAQARAYPHELSGGMKQRAMLAIALACRPPLLIADEPTTALDVTIQAQILDLLRRLREEMELTVLLITHDMGIIAENADRVGVMYAGRIVEEAPVEQLFADPKHPYTRGLLRAVPTGPVGGRDRRLRTLPGQVPDPSCFPAGCRFHPRCADRFEPCDRDEPPELALAEHRRVACHLYGSGSAPEGPVR